MQYGVVFPQTEFGNDTQAIKDYAQTAEALGYDYLLVYDHVLGAHPNREPKLTGPYTYEHPFHEPMVFFGFLAAVTSRLGLVTGILILPQRQTALVAKQTAEVDVMSGDGCALALGLAGITSSMTRSARNFRPVDAGSKSKSRCCASSGRNRWLPAKPPTMSSTMLVSIHCPCNVPSPSGSGALQSPCSSVPHGLVTGGCRLAGHRTTGSKPTLSSSMGILKRPAASAKILVLIPGSAFRGFTKTNGTAVSRPGVPWAQAMSRWIQCAPASRRRRRTSTPSGPSGRYSISGTSGVLGWISTALCPLLLLVGKGRGEGHQGAMPIPRLAASQDELCLDDQRHQPTLRRGDTCLPNHCPPASVHGCGFANDARANRGRRNEVGLALDGGCSSALW